MDSSSARNQFKQLLLMEQSRLREALSSARSAGETVELDQARVGRLSRMDAMQSQQMALETVRRSEQRLRQLAQALRRVEDDEYGYCIECDQAINPRRLEVDPAATMCIECAE